MWQLEKEDSDTIPSVTFQLKLFLCVFSDLFLAQQEIYMYKRDRAEMKELDNKL